MQTTNLIIEDISYTTINRKSDVNTSNYEEKLGLPIIDWSKVSCEAPKKIEIGNRSANDPLPQADWVVITWTSAEWQALDHVFLNSQSPSENDKSWRKDWHLYTRGSENYVADKQSGTLWGNFQLVEIKDQSNRPWRVLLFKSNSHLAHSPWIDGLSAMVRCILEDTQADRIYTIGTAGGARLTQALGDSVITNTATLELQRPQNTGDKDNGAAFRCPNWYPSTKKTEEVQNNLLFPLSNVATLDKLQDLYNQLKEKHSGDSSMDDITLNDLINEGLDQKSLESPKILNCKDAPLLTTDFYYIAEGDSAAAFAFLEMDDAIIVREANKMGVKVACIRNISDPIVPYKTKSGETIPENIRADWSGLIYQNFGLYTSFNGALATWSTIVSEGSSKYNPKRLTNSPNEEDPLEIKLAYQVRSCGTCSFFWPDKKSEQTYGPYTAFDFSVNTPYEAPSNPNVKESPWVLGKTRPTSFPNPEVSDGCRKAPIMTIGINPNLTAFAPGQNGAAWAYPNFSSDDNTNEWTKYAWYYRYRSVYQEKLSFDFIKKYILEEDRIIATEDGEITSVSRPDENPSWTFNVRYKGHASDTSYTVPGKIGDFPYMLLYDTFEPTNAFKAGDVLAGKLAVPEGITTEIYQATQGYYMQFVPTLKSFQDYLISKGHTGANLAIGEDVSQLDMVACASPHWTEGFLGNQMELVVNNCVTKNAWAIKQFVQTKPAILYIVSESSWNMFKKAYGNFVDQGKISDHPKDQSYTLLSETTKLDNPVYINFDFTVDGKQFQCKTRLVITPHFSFNTNFLPQYRMSRTEFDTLSQLPNFSDAITIANGFTILQEDTKNKYAYREIQLQNDTYEQSRANLKQNYPDLYNTLEPFYYNAHEMMSSVLNDMYDKGQLTYDDTNNYLNRTEGGCKFCVNQYWQFPAGCKYGKPSEANESAAFLESVANYIIQNGSTN